MDLKDINIGSSIENRVMDLGIEMPRICNFFNLPVMEIEKMYTSKSLDTEILLKWGKLLEYDFFKLYSQHLVLDPDGTRREYRNIASSLPRFRKNTYTKEMVEFIVEQVKTGEKTERQIIEEYMIPKATLYTWINKRGRFRK